MPSTQLPIPSKRPLLRQTQRGVRSRTRDSNSTRLRITPPTRTSQAKHPGPTRRHRMQPMPQTHQARHPMGIRPRRRRPHQVPRRKSRLLQQQCRRKSESPDGIRVGGTPSKTQSEMTAGEVSLWCGGFKTFRKAARCRFSCLRRDAVFGGFSWVVVVRVCVLGPLRI